MKEIIKTAKAMAWANIAERGLMMVAIVAGGLAVALGDGGALLIEWRPN